MTLPWPIHRSISTISPATPAGTSLNAEILRLFDGQVTEMVGSSGHPAQRDARAWREVTHTIKGAARGVGAFAMGEAAADAEPVDLAESAAQPWRRSRRLEDRSAEAVQAFIADYLARLKLWRGLTARHLWPS